MKEQLIVETQLEFYRKGMAGCLFAAHAAKDPVKYGWHLSVSEVDEDGIEKLIQSAITDSAISTQSIIFPRVITDQDLLNLLMVLQKTLSITLEQEEVFENMICLGYRAKIDELQSRITGFGSFDFLPETRQAVFTEIVFRSKPRPKYKYVMKEAPDGVVHLADMDMQGMGENQFKALWYGSFDNTEKRLGHKPNLCSAAKTTFAIPTSLWQSGS